MRRWGRIRIIALGALVAAGPARAQSTHLLVITGLGGGPEYSQRFREWGAGLVRAGEAAGLPPGDIVWLAERPDLDAAVNGPARKERVGAELAALARRVGPGDLVMIVLFGHGSERDGQARLNLPGPDLTGAELATMLEPLHAARTVVVNAASASGGFVAPLSAKGRVVITATRTGRESEATRFGGHFVEAFTGGGADTDKDGRVSMLEAWEYARRAVAREYQEAGRLATEHALIDDNGDGQGSLEPGGPDGALAARIALGPRTGPGATPTADSPDAAADPELRTLLAEKERLETALAELRTREESMGAEEYREALERLLLDIARNGQAIRTRQGGDGG